MPPIHTRSDDQSDATSLGDYLRAGRVRQRLSIRQVAALVETNPSVVLRWERGERVPKSRYLGALARSLDLPIATLLRLSGDETGAEALTLPAMLRAEYDLPPEAIREIQQHIETVAEKYGAIADTNQEIND